MSYKGADFARIRGIRAPNVVAWRAVGGHKPETKDSNYLAEYDKLWTETDQKGGTDGQTNGPAICLGTSQQTTHFIGLVPPAAKVGDVIVRFWGCDAALVMRPLLHGKTTYSYFVLVGRADISNGFDPKSEAADGRGAGGSSRASRAVLVDFDLPTLQMVTSFIDT